MTKRNIIIILCQAISVTHKLCPRKNCLHTQSGFEGHFDMFMKIQIFKIIWVKGQPVTVIIWSRLLIAKVQVCGNRGGECWDGERWDQAGCLLVLL